MASAGAGAARLFHPAPILILINAGTELSGVSFIAVGCDRISSLPCDAIHREQGMLRSDTGAYEDELFEQFERLEREDCIMRCHTCHRACLDLAAVLDRGYGVEAIRFATLLLDCAELNLLLASSLTDCPTRLNRPLALLCAEIGERCGAECARCIDEDDAEACIDACARSASACRRLSELETLQ